jgi:hypothetical protein
MKSKGTQLNNAKNRNKLINTHTITITKKDLIIKYH